MFLSSISSHIERDEDSIVSLYFELGVIQSNYKFIHLRYRGSCSREVTRIEYSNGRDQIR